MVNIITYGTFDLFHVGHLRLLERAKEMGDKLIVAVSTDDFNKIKGKKCIIPFKERFKIIDSLRCVDKVIPETCWEQKEEDCKKYNAQLVMGDDWEGKFENCLYLPRTENISTTQIKEKVRN